MSGMSNRSSALAARVLDAVRAVLAEPPVPLHAPVFRGKEAEFLMECLDSTFVSSVGPFVDRFERMLAKTTGAAHVVAVVNGTAALHVALRLAGVGAGDEVIVPALSFIATANAVAYCGAVPHFVDSEERTLGLDPGKLAEHLEQTAEMEDGTLRNRHTGRPIRAVVPVHVFGHPARMEEIRHVAEAFGLALVEDAAEALGSTRGGRHAGTFAPLGCLSFNGNKIITTGGGGAILTDDADLARHARHLTTTAKLDHPWEYRHDEIGYNYRMPNINAALGCAQLAELPGMLVSKRALHRAYVEAFRDIDEVTVVEEPEDCRSNYWLQALLLDGAYSDERDALLEALNAAGYMSRSVWGLLSDQAPYRACPRMDLSTAHSLARRIVNIPSGVGISRSSRGGIFSL